MSERQVIYVCYHVHPQMPRMSCPRVEAFTDRAHADEWVAHMRNYPGMEEGWTVMPTELWGTSAVPQPPKDKT